MSKYIIEKSSRDKLGSYLREVRESKKIGLNQLALRLGVVNSLISKLENGVTQKISPFLLREVAVGLNIDYKALYKIVGFLDKNDFEEVEMLKKKLLECENRLTISNNGSQIIGSTISGNVDNRSHNALIDFEKNKLDLMDIVQISQLFDITEEKAKDLIKYLKFLKSE